MQQLLTGLRPVPRQGAALHPPGGEPPPGPRHKRNRPNMFLLLLIILIRIINKMILYQKTKLPACPPAEGESDSVDALRTEAGELFTESPSPASFRNQSSRTVRAAALCGCGPSGVP